MRTALWLFPMAAACAPVAPGTAVVPDTLATGPGVAGDTSADLPPAGFGSLRQNEFSVEIVDMALHVKVTPLSEEVIRLAAPDTYERLGALGSSRVEQAHALTEGSGAEMFLVSFYSREPNVAYRPEELQITHRGRSLRPEGIIPLTTGWGRQLLQLQQTQSAIYVFEPDFDYDLPLTVHYGLQASDEWHRSILPRLEEERTRVGSRSGSRPAP